MRLAIEELSSSSLLSWETPGSLLPLDTELANMIVESYRRLSLLGITDGPHLSPEAYPEYVVAMAYWRAN